MEEHHAVAETMQAVLTSLVFEACSSGFRNCGFVIMEGGLGWIPSLSARMDKHLGGLRSEVPHLKRPPSNTSRAGLVHHPAMEEPARASQLIDLFDRIGWDRLLFSTDYPHWDSDGSALRLQAPLSAGQRDQLLLIETPRRSTEPADVAAYRCNGDDIPPGKRMLAT